VLASGSPRRRALLALAGFEFDVLAPMIDERRRGDEPVADYVRRVAAAKARAVAAQVPRGSRVLGCDTAVSQGDTVFGKPSDPDAAVAMLLALSGATHTVTTGYALVVAGIGEVAGGVDAARVTMRPISAEEAAVYVATGEPLDKAGAYAIQGEGRQFVTGVEGPRSTIIGLPLEHVVDLLSRHGVVPRRGGPGGVPAE
jgi:septum formation protein